MDSSELSEYLTLRQVSELLKIPPNILRNWDKSGTLKTIRIGEKKIQRYKKEDVIKFLEQQ
ncbi:helix-turn-helix domain-containing protein [Candidatus Saccharibacteria bacterium]|nr:helix-turn-helix domain-containing protein [Candidatus Saccharibacteria bacterium]